MKTVTISVSSGGATRGVTVLASRLIWAEILTTVLVFAVGFAVGRL